MNKVITWLALLGLSTSASAMFCPKNFNQINMGDTIEQVQQQCGKPDSQKTVKGEDNGPQEWTFYVHPQMKRYTETRTNSGQEASVKMTVAFNNGKVINITVNSMSLATTTVCGSSASGQITQSLQGISIGDSAKSVKDACGNPIAVSKGTESNDQKPIEMIEYTYNSSPPAVLVFEGGKLVERK